MMKKQKSGIGVRRAPQVVAIISFRLATIERQARKSPRYFLTEKLPVFHFFFVTLQEYIH